MDIKQLTIQKIQTKFPDLTFQFEETCGDTAVLLDKEDLVDVCKFLKEDEDLLFNFCEDVTAVDWATRKNRFTVVYQLLSLKNKFRLRLKVNLDEKDSVVDSVSAIWNSANWAEREVFDMFGIKFNNHPDLRRMYMPEEFEYYPLRKDFPLMGIPGSIPLPKK